MKRTTIRSLAFAGVLLVLLSASSVAGELDERLSFLKPLTGKEWVGGYVGPDAPDIELSLRFDIILDGKSVRYKRDAEAVNFSSVTHFYWDESRGEVRFLSLNNRGIVGEGVVNAENGRIVLHGMSHRKDKTMEFKTTLEIDEEGKLTDTFVPMEGGEWVQGHVQEFVAK